MIIFITGPTHTGKTKLAQKLLERLHIPYLSIDHLKMGLIRTRTIPFSVEDDENLTACLWPIVREIAKTALENDQDLIIEGCYFPCTWRNDFTPDEQKTIRMLAIALDPAYIDMHFDAIVRHANDIETRLDDSGLTKTALMRENAAFIQRFQEAGETVHVIRDDYEAQTRVLMNCLNRKDGGHHSNG